MRVTALRPVRAPLPPPARQAFAEFLGTGLLVAVVVGSGIMATELSPRDVGLQLRLGAAVVVDLYPRTSRSAAGSGSAPPLAAEDG